MDLQDNKPKAYFRYLPLVIIGVVMLVYWATFKELIAAWTVWDQSLSHGIPLAMVFIYLVFGTLPWVRRGPSSISLIVGNLGLFVFSILWFAASLIHFQIVEQLCILPIIVFSLIIIFGIDEVWKYRMILLVPIYVIPVWDFINVHLVNLSGYMVGIMVSLSSLPAMIDGNSIHIPSGQIIIAGGCSGLRYLIISLALAHIISCLNGYKEKGLLSALLLAASLGLLTNWIRIFLLILIGHETEMKSSLMEDHEFFGWILFGCVALPAIYFAPVVKVPKGDNTVIIESIKIQHLLLFFVILASGPALRVIADFSAKDMDVSYLVDQDKFQASYTALPHALVLSGVSSQDNYISPTGAAHLQINRYFPSKNGGRLVPYIGEQFDIETWKKEYEKVELVNSHNVLAQIFKNKNTKQVIVQVRWMDVGGLEASSVLKAKLNQLWAIVTGHNYFALITLQQVCELPNCEKELPELLQLSEFIRK